VTKKTHRLTDAQVRQIRRYHMDARELPPRGEVWLSANIAISSNALNVFSQHGIIEKCRTEDTDSTRAYRWETAAGVTAFVENNMTDVTRTPCGCSSGVRCIESGELYACVNDECDVTFPRDVADAVVQNEPLPSPEVSADD